MPGFLGRRIQLAMLKFSSVHTARQLVVKNSVQFSSVHGVRVGLVHHASLGDWLQVGGRCNDILSRTQTFGFKIAS